MQSDIAEKAALHDRALIVVNTAEPETTQLLCDTLRGQLAVEASSPSGSEQVQIHTSAETSYEYKDIQTALREI